MGQWSFITNHARVLLLLAGDPDARLRDLAAALDITERTAFGIVTDLVEAGYLIKQRGGRRNRYHIQEHLPLPDPIGRERTIGEVLELLAARHVSSTESNDPNPPTPSPSQPLRDGRKDHLMLTTTGRKTIINPPSPPSTPRLRLGSPTARHTLLDGGWWPRSVDPVAELPGLVLAIEHLHGPVTQLILHADDWDRQPHRIGMAGRVLRLAYFTSQPAGLLTALCGRNGNQVDLLIVPPGTDHDTADAAMALAATADNQVHAQHIVGTVRARDSPEATSRAAGDWESEGGRLAS